MNPVNRKEGAFMAQPSNDYKAKYSREHYARIEIAIPKDAKAVLDAVAKAAGENTAEYIKKATLMRMGVNEWPIAQKD